jgi:release factor glutamine methyltransferase
MAEFHRLPSLQSESSHYVSYDSRFDDPTTTTTTDHNDDDDDDVDDVDDDDDDDTYEKEIVQHWDAWNDAAMQLAAVQSSASSSSSTASSTATVPSLDHLTYRDYESVYEPSDDTYLLMDALQYELQHIVVCYHHHHTHTHTHTHTPAICLEIGCGTGVVSAFVRQYWMTHMCRSSSHTHTPHPSVTHPPCDAAATTTLTADTAATLTSGPSLLSYVTDINPIALRVTQRTFQQLPSSPPSPLLPLLPPTTRCQSRHPHGQQHHVECIQCDLATPLLRQLQHQVDFMIFNPPYVPTANEEIGVGRSSSSSTSSNTSSSSDDVLRASYAGGTNGRMVMDRALPQIVQLLRRPSRCHPRSEDDHVEDGSTLDTTTAATTTTTTIATTTTTAAAYIVTVDDNLPLDIALQIDRLSQHQLCCRPLFRKRVRNEFLTIQKITWRNEKQ